MDTTKRSFFGALATMVAATTGCSAAPTQTTDDDGGVVVGNDAASLADAAPDVKYVDDANYNNPDALPPGAGWNQLAGTSLLPACPSATQYPAIQGNEGCAGVINDWGGGAAD